MSECHSNTGDLLERNWSWNSMKNSIRKPSIGSLSWSTFALKWLYLTILESYKNRSELPNTQRTFDKKSVTHEPYENPGHVHLVPINNEPLGRFGDLQMGKFVWSRDSRITFLCATIALNPLNRRLICPIVWEVVRGNSRESVGGNVRMFERKISSSVQKMIFFFKMMSSTNLLLCERVVCVHNLRLGVCRQSVDRL